MSQDIKVGIVGGGFVGTATSKFAGPGISVIIYDVDSTRCLPVDTTMKEIVECNLIFVCVPTPSNSDDSCNTKFVEDVIETIRSLKLQNTPPIIVRSTVSPGTCQRLGVVFFPEFLRETTFLEDFRTTSTWLIGISNEEEISVILLIKKLLRKAKENGSIVSNDLLINSSTTTELIKYARNAFLATKVSFCNEMYNLCEKLDIDWENVQKGFAMDSRIGESHTHVPGKDGKFGFGGNCLPKDTLALEHEFRRNHVNSYTISGAILTNFQMRN